MVLGALLLAERSARSERAASVAGVFLAGLLLGLVVDTHPNGAAFFPLVGLVFPLRQGWRRFLRRRADLGLWPRDGGCRPLLPGSTHPCRTRPASWPALGYWVGVDKAPPVAGRAGGGLLGKLDTMVMTEILRYRDYFGEEPLELGLVVLGLAGGLWMALRGLVPGPADPARPCVRGVFFIVAVSTKSKYYMLLHVPAVFVAAGAGAGADGGVGGWISSSRGPRASQRLAPTRCGASRSRVGAWRCHSRSPLEPLRCWFSVILVVGAMIWPLKVEERAWDNYIRARRYREGQEYTQLTDRLDALAGPGARILAPPIYWIGLHDHPYIDIYVFERLQRQYGMSPAQFLDEVQPDVVITDAKIATDRRIERMLYDELDRRATVRVDRAPQDLRRRRDLQTTVASWSSLVDALDLDAGARSEDVERLRVAVELGEDGHGIGRADLVAAAHRGRTPEDAEGVARLPVGEVAGIDGRLAFLGAGVGRGSRSRSRRPSGCRRCRTATHPRQAGPSWSR